ncbi:hypothetical protein D3C80_2175330 [compost metagenome]
MQIRMADTTKGDIDLYVMGSRCAAADLQRLKRFVARVSTIGFYKHGKVLSGGVG